uniref:Cadherin domain-containing protein n=1 Tax=Romanomermis culicivorax TaxID=13658 RepID=A0A915HUI9_ROMCU
PSPYFDINTTTGSLYVSGPLDRENPEIFKSSGTLILQVVAEEDGRDFGDSKPKSTLMLTIVITDVDDEKPRCNQTLYEAKIFEDAQRMIPLVFTNAQDLVVYDNDEGPNGQFELSIVGPNSLFDINPKKILNVGTVIVRLQESNVLDFERQKVLWLQSVLSPTVTHAGKTPACDIRVQILDSNDNVPQFSHKSYYGVVMENSKPGTSIINVTAFDLDTAEYGPLIYSLHGPGSDLFHIDDHVGTVRTKRTLDRERKSEYELTVTVQDENGKGHKNSTNLKIYVADDNDNAPKFKSSLYVVYLYENSVEFSAVGNGSREFMVEAFDADQPHTANSNITYTIDRNDEDQNHGHLYFLIDESSGRIKVRPPGVDLESMRDNLFNLTVSAHDQNKIRPLFSSVQVLVYVNDTNDNRPTFDRRIYNISILENATYPYNLAQLKAIDNDRSYFNSLIAYRIVNVQDKFTIHPEIGVLSLSESVKFDREAANNRHYRLNISATDQGIPSNTGFTIISINVVDINDKPPVFREKSHHVNVKEDARHGKILLNLTAVDPDEDVHLFYYVAGFEDAKTEGGTMVDRNK